MQTENHVAIGKLPTQEDWAKAKGLLLKEISRLEKWNYLSVPVEPNFSEFMMCVLFLMEKVGVQELMSANDTMRYLEKIYNENGLFYPVRIFRGAWSETDMPGMITKRASIAECFIERLKEIGMVQLIHEKEIIFLGSLSSGASEELKTARRFFLEHAWRVFGQKNNEKYISQISWVAYALFMAMYKGNEEVI
ncbi:MAG: hypothetical protein Q7S81_01380 [bacterium]|nr:hypothetical protein [bacterium]